MGYRDIVTRDEGRLVGGLWCVSRLKPIEVVYECRQVIVRAETLDDLEGTAAWVVEFSGFASGGLGLLILTIPPGWNEDPRPWRSYDRD